MNYLISIIAVFLLGCSADVHDMPDADAGSVGSGESCSQYQSFPPPCYADECSTGWECRNERECGVWEDTGVFGCRVLFSCECN